MTRRKTPSGRTMTRVAMRRAGAWSGHRTRSYAFAGGLALLGLFTLLLLAAALNSSGGFLFLVLAAIAWLAFSGKNG
jgi:hypothetical protein